MNKLLELEKKNQEYQFNYNCLSPINKKEFLIALSHILNKDITSAKNYDLFLNQYSSLINQYYDRIQSGVSPEIAAKECFQLNSNDIPLEFRSITFNNSGITKHRNFYLNDEFFNNEFNSYWIFLTSEILMLCNYDITNINNLIFKNAFINMHAIKYNKHNKSLKDYFQDIKNQVPQLSNSYNVDAVFLNNYPVMKLLATTLICCESSFFDSDLKCSTQDVIKDLYLLLDINASKCKQKVA